MVRVGLQPFFETARREVSQRVVGAFLVVGDHPFMDHLSHLGEGVEKMSVEHLVAEGAVEAFDVGVLGWFAGLDVVEQHAVPLAPGDEFGRNEFGTVVDADLERKRTAFAKLVENPDDPLGWQRAVDLDGQGLAHPLVEDIEGPEAFAAV